MAAAADRPKRGRYDSFCAYRRERPGFCGAVRRAGRATERAGRRRENRAAYIPLNRTDDVRTVVLAYDGEQPAGGGGLRRLDAGCAEVKRLFVRPACRGRGIAAQVMALLERAARAQGCRRLVLETGETLAAAMALYRKLGYRVIPNYGPYRGMDDSICMQKDL